MDQTEKNTITINFTAVNKATPFRIEFIPDKNTIKNINAAAMKEFIANGYKNASLRSIAREAGVTTGAFYGYYKSKEVLFSSIVDSHAAYLKALFSPSSGESYSRIQREYSFDARSMIQ